MEANGHDRKLLVCLLELMGTALFIFGILNTNDALGIPFSLMASVVIFGDITGGHFNPAVTIGVFTSLGDYGKNWLFMVMIIVSQIIGGFVAIALTFFGTYNQPDYLNKTMTPSNPAQRG